jgi:hypothetical protein
MKINSGSQGGADIFGEGMARDSNHEASLAGAIDGANALGSLTA